MMGAGKVSILWVLSLSCGALLASYSAQYLFGLTPCNLCLWQRYAHIGALAVGIACLVRPSRTPLMAALYLILLAGLLISSYHTAVIYGLLESKCAASIDESSIEAYKASLFAQNRPCSNDSWLMLGLPVSIWNILLSGLEVTLVLKFALSHRKQHSHLSTS